MQAVDVEPTEVITIRNANGLQADILAVGATIHRLLVPDRNGVIEDVVLGYDSPKHYQVWHHARKLQQDALMHSSRLECKILYCRSALCSSRRASCVLTFTDHAEDKVRSCIGRQHPILWRHCWQGSQSHCQRPVHPGRPDLQADRQ